jgi:hypothetical protein
VSKQSFVEKPDFVNYPTFSVKRGPIDETFNKSAEKLDTCGIPKKRLAILIR